jgi:hypothetical protein
MSNVSKQQRDIIREYIFNSDKYDAATMQIDSKGTVSARLDGNKTYSSDDGRYMVGYVCYILDDKGQLREGM